MASLNPQQSRVFELAEPKSHHIEPRMTLTQAVELCLGSGFNRAAGLLFGVLFCVLALACKEERSGVAGSASYSEAEKTVDIAQESSLLGGPALEKLALEGIAQAGESPNTAEKSSTQSAQKPSKEKLNAQSAEPASAAQEATNQNAQGEKIYLVRGDGRAVPLHAGPRDQAISARIPSGSQAEVIGVDQASKWRRVRIGKKTGWVSPSYIKQTAGPIRESSQSKISNASIWYSREACLSQLSLKTFPARSHLRIASWNIRWFPNGAAGTSNSAEPTDLEWLACAIASLDVDGIALQEITESAKSRTAMNTVIQHLKRLTAEDWTVSLDNCTVEDQQKVGWLYRSARLAKVQTQTVAELNPNASACAGRLRPGQELALSNKNGEVIRLLSVHFKSGKDARSYGLRDKSFSVLPLGGKAQLVVGDFNTMGCSDCEKPVSAQEESLARQLLMTSKGAILEAPRLNGAAVAFSSTTPSTNSQGSSNSTTSCTEYYDGHAGLLDYALFSDRKEPLFVGAKVSLSGYCAALACGSLYGEYPEAFKNLSDHCPFTVELPGFQR